MKCPFRVDENGNFKECYESECMAYFEYKTVSAPFARPSDFMTSAVVEKKTVPGCKKMLSFYPVPSSCQTYI